MATTLLRPSPVTILGEYSAGFVLLFFLNTIRFNAAIHIIVQTDGSLFFAYQGYLAVLCFCAVKI